MPNVRLAFSDDHESLSVRHNAPVLQLFDPDSMLEISRDVADGFLILLSNGLKSFSAIKSQREKERKKNGVILGKPSNDTSGENTEQSPPAHYRSEELSAIQLAFAALTDGNVIEATFGVESNGGTKRSKNTSEIAFNAAKTAKQAIVDAAISSDFIRQLAIETYAKAFEVVITYHINLESVGIITWCVKHQKFRDFASEELVMIFRSLNEAISASI